MATERSATATLAIPRPGTPPTPVVPRPERFTLDNGLRILAVPRSDFPQIAVRLIIPAGSSVDPSNAPGAASLVGSLLTEGTEQYPAIELNRRIDSLGAALCARVGHDFTEIDLGLLAETVDDGLELLAEVVTSPTFPERELERVRAEVLDALEGRLDEPANVADDAAAEAVFGEAHPYGRLPIGTPEGVRSIGRADLVGFHEARYRPAGSVLLIAGDFNASTLGQRLEAKLGRWRGDPAPTPELMATTQASAAGSVLTLPWEDAAQSEIRFAGVGLARSSASWIPAAVANYILGGSTITGRLGANLREDKGWTYGVRSSFAAGVAPAGWVIDTAVGAEVTRDAVDEITAELSRLVTEPLADEELARAKEAMILSLPRAFETPARIVARFATVEAFGLATDYWESFPAVVQQVTAEEIQRLAVRLFSPERLVRIVVGPPFDG
jgi:zinc protease